MHKLKEFLSLWGGVVLLAFIVCLALTTTPTAANGNDWIENTGLNLQKLSSSQPIPLSNGALCTADSTSCAVSTFYGASEGSRVRLASQTNYYDVVSYIDNRTHFIAVPNSDQFITYTTDAVYGFYFYFNGSFSHSFTKVNNFGTTQYKINRAPDGKLVDKGGTKLAADNESLSFSENGQWLTVVDPNVTALRVNLQTYDVLPFGQSYNYSIGLSPGASTAVSNDGRYAVVSSRTFNSFSIYDLSTCPSAIPAHITGPLSCRSTDLNSYLKQQVGGYMWSSNIRFISNDTLSFVVVTKVNGSLKSDRYLLSTQSGQLHQLDYLAIGDSYISGEGAFDYEAGTDTTINSCHLSLRSYPLLLGNVLSYNSYHSVACSGATTDDIMNQLADYAGQATSKIARGRYTQNQVDGILNQFDPGYLDQLEFIKQYQPRVITLSVGGNDIGFASILHSCVMPGTCYSSYEDRLELVRLINSKFDTLVSTYSAIKNNALPDTKIYIIGYPQIANPEGKCDTNVHLDNNELGFSTQLISYFDDVISRAASKAGVYYVDTQHALDGHRLCEASGASVAVNGLTAGNNFPEETGGPIGSESYHPNEMGHQMLEQAIPLATQNFSLEMLGADPAAQPPSEANLAILNAPKSGRAINTSYFADNISSDVALRSQSQSLSLIGSTYLVKPGSSVDVVLHSTPADLGTFVTDSNGNFGGNVIIPANIEPGVHTLHFYATDIFGNPLDIYKSIFVEASANDYDGDGISNSQEACAGIVQPSNQDIDRDGIDDACDGTIGPVANNLTTSQPAIIQNANYASAPNASVVVDASQPNLVPLSPAFESQDIVSPSSVLAATDSSNLKTQRVLETHNNLPIIAVTILAFSLLAGTLRFIYWKH